MQLLVNRIATVVWLLLSLLACTSSQAEPAEIDAVLIRPFRLGALSMDPSTTVLTKEDLRQKESATIAEVLKEVVGVDVATSGGAGQPSSVFIRGAKSEHTLVLIDGIEASDPTTTTRFFDFSSLTVENVERIEIYRGARSTRFGGDAIGGVINIVTIRGIEPSKSGLGYEGGSYSTHRFSSHTSGARGRFNYSAGASHLSSDGFSSAETAQVAENDSLVRTSLSTRLGWDFTSGTMADFTFRFIDTTTSLDASGGPAGDDPNYDSKSQQILTGMTLSTNEIIDGLQSSLGFYFNSAKRQYDNFPDPSRTTDYHETFKSDSLKLETTQRYAVSESVNFEFSIQYRQEAGESDQIFNAVATRLGHQQQSVIGEALGFDIKFGSLTFDVGLRHDQVSITSESVLSHSVAGEYRFDETGTAFQVNHGSGFKNPSLFQLYSNFGSLNLQTERATTFDVSVEQRLGQFGLVTLTWFQTKFQSLIDFDMVNSRYSNIASAKSEGLELNSNLVFSDVLTGSVGVKSLQVKDGATGFELVRRPSKVLLVGLEWRPSRLTAALRFRYSGDRDEIDPVTFGRIRQPAYQVWSAAFRYELSNQFETSFRIENIADLAYQEVAGYTTSRRAYYAGLSAGF